MVLFIIHDSVKNTYSQPLFAETFVEARSSLITLNPENLSDLIIIPLIDSIISIPTIIDSLVQNYNPSELPITFRSADSTLSATLQPEGASGSI